MLEVEARQAVTTLAEAALAVRPLVDQLGHPVPVAGPAGVAPVVDRVSSRLGSPRFAVGRPFGPGDTFARVVSDHLNVGALARPLSTVPSDAMTDVDAVVDGVVAGDFDSFCETARVCVEDGNRVRAYAAGRPHAPVVVIATACGMPARLAEKWVRDLSRDHYVLTWETRGLFGDLDDFDGATDVETQAGDLYAVMDRFGVRTAHIMGLCGGAVIALAAARQQPDRVSSLSLWHGDFDLGGDAPKTDHQRNLQALMAMATQARVSATGIHAVVCQSMLDSVPPDLAHLVLYPYATAELLYRYCQLNGAIMATDVRPHLSGVDVPVLVVTSEDDTTAHPDGSRAVAARLRGAELRVIAHGDHIALFRGAAELLEIARRFLSKSGRLKPAGG